MIRRHGAVPLPTASRVAELLTYDGTTGSLFWRSARGKAKAGYQAGYIAGNGRVYVQIDRRMCLAHRVAWVLVHGDWPPVEIDHINGDPADNRLSNLRLATSAENKQNQRRARSDNKSTGIIGVRRRRGSFWASIGTDGQRVHMGPFATAQDAHVAYVTAKRSLHPFGVL